MAWGVSETSMQSTFGLKSSGILPLFFKLSSCETRFKALPQSQSQICDSSWTMAKRKGSSSASRPRTRNEARRETEVDRDAREVENAQRLDKLPQEVWEKILDNLHKNDLFPLALSCRYFRQKEKELVDRKTRESRSESVNRTYSRRLTLWSQEPYYIMQPASPDYLRFCRDCGTPWLDWTRLMYLAAYHGHLTLLQELVISSETHLPNDFSCLADYAGESSSSPSSLFWLLTSFSSSQRAEASWRPCSG